MGTTFQTDLEDARQRLAEGLERVREQLTHVERLNREGKPIRDALALLAAMREIVVQMETHLHYLVETEGRQE
jgi:hypothetical protein